MAAKLRIAAILAGGAAASLSAGLALSFASCHKVYLPDEIGDGGNYDVAAPPDAVCGDARCAYATIGLPEPTPEVYTDMGAADVTGGFRALISLPIQNQAQLEAAIAAMYTPGSPTFRHYLTAAEWTSTYAPSSEALGVATDFVTARGMKIERTSTNGVLVEFTGTVAQFNSAFQTTLHNFTRANPEQGGAPIVVYGVTQPAVAPAPFVHAISAIVTCDTAAVVGSVPQQPGTPGTTPPSNLRSGFTPAQIADVYDATALLMGDASGQGVTIGLVSGGAFGPVDVQTFWKSFAISRADPVAVEVMEPPTEILDESNIDAEWSGAMAPSANIRVYEGADALDTSLLYAFNEAVGRDEIQVLSDSFSSREDSEAIAVADSYDVAAMQAAAFGITVLASSGDGGKPDVPSASSYVTAVGGTALTFNDAGTSYAEVAWATSGSGPTQFPVPSWQSSLVTSGFRETADFSVNAGPYYWWYYLGQWQTAFGTSFASPTAAGIIADVISARASSGMPALGYLNSILYSTASVQATFRDITMGATASYPATKGWDPPTGWGALQGKAFAAAFP